MGIRCSGERRGGGGVVRVLYRLIVCLIDFFVFMETQTFVHALASVFVMYFVIAHLARHSRVAKISREKKREEETGKRKRKKKENKEERKKREKRGEKKTKEKKKGRK